MIALRLPDVKTMTSQLFVHEAFDYFLVSEASFTTYCTFMIDGHVKSDFYSSEETEQSSGTGVDGLENLKAAVLSADKRKQAAAVVQNHIPAFLSERGENAGSSFHLLYAGRCGRAVS